MFIKVVHPGAMLALSLGELLASLAEFLLVRLRSEVRVLAGAALVQSPLILTWSFLVPLLGFVPVPLSFLVLSPLLLHDLAP